MSGHEVTAPAVWTGIIDRDILSIAVDMTNLRSIWTTEVREVRPVDCGSHPSAYACSVREAPTFTGR